MKPLAIYFPAFQQTPENDEWWGEGFTEWDNVRNARRYFKGQQQPLIPLHHNYYDLSQKKDIEQQIRTALQFGVEGFIFYHYWFSSEKQMFSKPAETLRDEITLPIKYCFCWANETWASTWHGKQPRVLLQQTYGDHEEWLKHIAYLFSFMKDARYLRIDGRPLMFIYNASAIPRYEEMIRTWDAFLQEQGEQPLYVVEFISSKNRQLQSLISDAVVEFEPLYTTFFDLGFFNLGRRALAKLTKTLDYQNYDYLWNKIIHRRRTYHGKPIFKSGFVAWDNSPRKERAAMIVRGSTPAKFGKYIEQLLISDRPDARSDYFVLNAWNEWSEGPILEPTEQNGYSYLSMLQQAVKKAER